MNYNIYTKQAFLSFYIRLETGVRANESFLQIELNEGEVSKIKDSLFDDPIDWDIQILGADLMASEHASKGNFHYGVITGLRVKFKIMLRIYGVSKRRTVERVLS